MLPEWVITNYDDFGRANTITDISVDKNIRVTTSNYNRFTVTTAFGDFEKSVKTNIFGKTESITEDSKTVSHTFYSDGLLATTSHMGEKTIEIFYDDRGHKRSMSDSASGTWAYKYNAFGELYWQKDAENNVIEIEYDIIGRKVKESTPEGSLSWYYHNSGNGIGQLEKEVGIGNERLYAYDPKGRLNTVTLNIDGRKIVTKHQYDQIGRNSQVILNSDGDMPTPLYKSYNDGGRLQSYSLPASALKSFDFNGLEDDFTKTLARIKSLEKLITDALQRVTAHEARAVEFSAKADMYERSIGSANQLVKDLRKKALQHSNEASSNYRVWQDYVKKSKNYTGHYAVRRFIYKGLQGNTHKFEYQGGCAKKKTTLGIFKRCTRYHSYPVNMEKFEFNQLSATTKNTKVCRATWSDFRISAGKSGTRINPKYSQGKYLRSETKRVKTGSAKSGYKYKNVTTKFYEWCKVKEYLPKELYLEIANNYKALYDKKKKYTAFAKKSEASLAANIKKHSDGKWYINGLPKTDYRGENPTALKKLAVNNGGGFSEAVDNYKASNLSQLLAHYKQQFEHYSRLAGNESKGFDTENDGLATLRQDKVTEKKAYDILFNQVQQLGSIDRLKSLAQSQSELMSSDSKLIVWSALNWHTDGRLKDEIYGNGLRTIRKFDHSTGGLDSITTQNANDHVLSDIHYEFNDRGYVESIEDSVSGYTDTFNYDADMLDSWSRAGHGKNYSYDYEYDRLGNLTHKQSGTQLNHFGDVDKPYQITSHKGAAITFDEKGFVTSAKGSTYDWSSFGKAKRINANGKVTTFGYDAGNNRVKRVDSSGTTYYVAPGYEQVAKNNGDVIHRIHIRNGYESVATLERYEYAAADDISRPVDFASYYHRDMLGTGVLVTGSKAEVLSRKGFTPYGEALPDYMLVPSAGNAMTASSGVTMPGMTKARAATHQIMSSGMSAGLFKAMVKQAEQASDVPLSDEEFKLLARALTVNSVIDGLRGFTGHEMLEDSQLVHMNARIYDPAMGRFMTPDSVIPDVNKPQAYNRYSYVYNNPATYTDPSGHNPLAIAAIYFVMAHTYSDSQFHQTLSSVLLAAATMGAVEPTTVAGAAATAGATTLVTSAALSGRISGTELRSAALSAVAAGVAFKIGNVNVSDSDWAYKVMYHGAAQGTIGWVRNKNFWGSALAGAAGHASGVAMQSAGLLDGAGFGDVAARTAVSATFGGLASAATGGDFAQGAMIGAIVHLYNSESHKYESSYDENDPYYHRYEMNNEICSLSETCSAGAVWGELKKNPAPGWDNSKQVATGDETKIVFAGLNGGTVSHVVDDANMTLYNVTHSDHIFSDGYVSRSVYVRGGSVYVKSIGEGITSSSSFRLGGVPFSRALRAGLNIDLYKSGFDSLDNNIRSAF
jgi:RHS repeat-associated protein